MKIIFYLKGLSPKDKNSFVKNNDLKDHLISKSEIRFLYTGCRIAEDGNSIVDKSVDDKVDSLVFDIMKNRMKKGDLLVYDPEGPNQYNLNRFIQLSKSMNYRAYIIDFKEDKLDRFSIIKEDSMMENKRLGTNRVNNMLHDMLAISKDKLYNSVEKISIGEAQRIMQKKPVDLTKYKKIHHIGDVHGNYKILKKMVGEIRDDEFYIFHGDYIDGPKNNHLVLDYLYKISSKKNVVLLRGNHERSLDKHLNGEYIDYKHYNNITKKEIESMDNWKLKIKTIVDNLQDMFYYKYMDIEMICSHGGISSYTSNFNKIPSDVFIKGAGEKKNTKWVCKNFEESVGYRPIYQSFGHRSTKNIKDLLIDNKSFNINANPKKRDHFLKGFVLRKGRRKNYSQLYNNVFFKKQLYYN